MLVRLGYVARVRDQQTTFGASLDVFLDNTARLSAWFLSQCRWGVLLSAVEWTTFAFTAVTSSNWKRSVFRNSPKYVEVVVSNCFRCPLGVFSIAGLDFLPLIMYLQNKCVESDSSLACVLLTGGTFNVLFPVLLLGRILCLVIEFWVLRRAVARMITGDLVRRVHCE